VARGADIVSRAVRDRLAAKDCPRPLISSACPAVVRLIQIRFPELIGNIIDVRSPMEVAATVARREFCEKNGAAPEDVGCFFITPCAAKATVIRNPLGHRETSVNGAISILEIYGLLSGQLRRESEGAEASMQPSTALGIGWARSGGECAALDVDEALAVDGIENVAGVLDAIENDRMPALRFFEGLACAGGCVGGPIVFENHYIARNRIRRLVQELPKRSIDEAVDPEEIAKIGGALNFNEPIRPLDALRIDTDFRQALAKMEKIGEIRKRLPGLDCGSCGSPTCQALAEDIVAGDAREMDCLFLLKERVQLMAKQMMELSEMTREK
jgi:hypothetical protein